MEHVELVVMGRDPLCVEGRWRPPLRRWDARAHDGIRQSHDPVRLTGLLKMPHIDVAGRNREDADLV
jgi:hypothetical protein